MSMEKFCNKESDNNDFSTKPNFTQIPNIVLDILIPHLSGSEVQVLLIICRQTYGWHKKIDKISNSQMSFKTGLSGKAMLKAVKSLVKKRIILKSTGSGRKISEYYFNRDSRDWKFKMKKEYYKLFHKSTTPDYFEKFFKKNRLKVPKDFRGVPMDTPFSSDKLTNTQKSSCEATQRISSEIVNNRDTKEILNKDKENSQINIIQNNNKPFVDQKDKSTKVKSNRSKTDQSIDSLRVTFVTEMELQTAYYQAIKDSVVSAIGKAREMIDIMRKKDPAYNTFFEVTEAIRKHNKKSWGLYSKMMCVYNGKVKSYMEKVMEFKEVKEVDIEAFVQWKLKQNTYGNDMFCSWGYFCGENSLGRYVADRDKDKAHKPNSKFESLSKEEKKAAFRRR